MKKIISLFSVLVGLGIAGAVLQELTIYSELNAQGNSITFRSKEPDLTNYEFFLNNAQSYCYIGW